MRVFNLVTVALKNFYFVNIKQEALIEPRFSGNCFYKFLKYLPWCHVPEMPV